MLLAAAGCAEPETHTERTVIEEPVDSLTVDVRSGDVHIYGGDVSEVTATATIVGGSNHLGHSFTGGKLTLVDVCHENHCSVDVSVEVPSGVSVTVQVASGDLELYEMLGAINVATGSGDILGYGLAGAALDAETGSGDVALEVSEPAERIHVRTHSGDVSLGVPAGAYRLDVGTNSGDRHVSDVSNDSRASGSIDVFTGSGDVAIRGY
ncbi:MAG TPA: DUF4097 family beta strand repeat-containing protein [Polyangiaceae bacterium]|nr:DUF4097 family beta strand repeat-containing protein [Polyangiaceae bacterium]